MDCIFCEIIDKKIPATIRYEDESIIAFDDIHPKAPIHVLVIPKKHIPTLNDVSEADDELLAKIIRVAKKIASDLGISENGYRISMNCNRDGGQEVFHIHLHLFGGKKLNWPTL